MSNISLRKFLFTVNFTLGIIVCWTLIINNSIFFDFEAPSVYSLLTDEAMLVPDA